MMVETASLLEELQQNGFIVLREFFNGSELDRLQEDAAWFLENPRDWFELTTTAHAKLANISPPRVPPSEQERVQRFFDTFTQPVFLETCLGFLGNDAYVDRILVHKETAHPQPVTEWHADQQGKGLLSFKFMVYFNDVDARNGAFSYVPGSHRIVHELVRQARLRGVPNTALHHFEQMKQVAHEYQFTDAMTLLEKLASHIQGDYESDDHYSLSAPRGSVILFDTKGIHRGGVVWEGERFIMRVHCFEPPPLSWKGRLKRLVVNQDRGTRFFSIGGTGPARAPIKEYG